MIKKIKAAPRGVILSALFLLCLYAALAIAAPLLWFFATICFGTIVAALRLAHYLDTGN